MKRMALCLASVALALCALAPPAHAAFGLTAHEVSIADSGGDPFTQAGSHPFDYTTTIAISTIADPGTGFPIPEEELKNLYVELPPGLIGNPTVAPTCPGVDFISFASCPPDTAVGTAISTTGPGSVPDVDESRVYNLEPTPGTAARFGFRATGIVPVTIAATLSSEPPYRIIARVENVPQINPVLASDVTLWGTPADSAHDAARCSGGCSTSLPKRAFLTMPRSCPGTPLGFAFEASSWVKPDTWLEYFDTEPPSSGCEALAFDPEVGAAPTTHNAESPSGFGFSIDVEDKGLTDPLENAESDLKRAVVTLPQGLTVNPASADGLGACSEGELARETPTSAFGAGCPAASKVASVEVETPLLEEILQGSLFLATPYENPLGSLLAGYLVIKSPERGVAIKLAGKIDPDPETGQLTASFDDNPQLPFSALDVEFKVGNRAPLITPPTCGTYEVKTELHPWSGEAPLTDTDTFAVDHGPNGGACVAGDPGQPGNPADAARLPNAPGFDAGTVSPIARASSPFVLNLSRADGTQRFEAVTVTPPPGLLAKLAGTTTCPDAALAAAAGRTGRAEQQAPSCLPASEVGDVTAAAGAGPTPYNAPGKVYLAGPYKGAPLSLAVITPAVAGPFDLGTIVVRAALRVDPRTAQITAVSDPIPQILQGIPLDVRDVSISLDRPDFTLNPTSCDPMAVAGQLTSIFGALADLRSRFQLAECGRLGFKPKLALRLKGGTKRGMNPKLIASLKARPGDANIGRTQVTLPRSAFLDQGHIRTVCTRVQWAADACPKGSIYGRAQATSPLLDYPIAGNVYLRSSDNELPDLVADLRGPAHQPIRIELVGRTDAVKGALRNTFDVVPDAPVDRFRLELFGGKRGLVENSRNLCEGTQRAKVVMDAQNGRRLVLRPKVGKECGKKKRRAQHRRTSTRG